MGAAVEALAVGSKASFTPSARAVLGMSCIRPLGSSEMTASGRNPDSTATTARTSSGSRPCRRAAASTISARPVGWLRGGGQHDFVKNLVRHDAAQPEAATPTSPPPFRESTTIAPSCR